MTRQPVQPHELEPLAAHVREEYERLRLCTTGAIGLYGSKGGKALLRDLFVTALNIHARNLVSFFDGRSQKSHPEDVHATDYADGWQPTRDGAYSLFYLKECFLPGVHKRLAHISAHRVRVSADEDAVQIVEIYLSIALMMQRFIDILPPERRRWFERDGKLPDTTPSALGMVRTT